MLDIITNDVKSLNVDFSKMKNKSVLITGASGLIGLYFLACLKNVQKDYNIKIYTWNKKNNNLFDSLFEGCERIICDITDYTVYDSLPKFDYIIHSSGYGQPGKFLVDKIKTIEINTTVTIKLLEKLKDDGSFLFISSSEVYNGLYKLGIEETEVGQTTPSHPRAPYIEGKRCGEAICNAYKEKGRNIKIARLSIAYGPGTQTGDTRVINSLIDKGIKNNRIDLEDNGESVRTICYIIDTMEMFWNILFYGNETVYNVGGIHSVTILELANKIGSLLGTKVYTPEKENELIGSPKFVNLSIDRYLNEFEKKDFTSIEEGLFKTIKWQKKLNERHQTS
jgi:nucleoside-diphosphate-sugar epimerase